MPRLLAAQRQTPDRIPFRPINPKKESIMTLTASDPPPSEIDSPEFIASFLRRQTNLKHFLVVWRDGRQIVFQIQPNPTS